MARIRTIKPEFPHSESMGRVSRDARLLFVLLWTICDDSGRTRAASRMLASLLFPYDDGEDGHPRTTGKEIDAWLVELEREGCVIRYSVDGTQYLQVCNWLNHQKIDKPSSSKIPEPSRIVANPREPSVTDLGPRTKDLGEDQEKSGADKPRSGLPRTKSDRQTFATFVADCRAKGEKPITEEHPIFAFAESAGIPVEFVRLAWFEFRRTFGAGGKDEKKTQAGARGWRAHFDNAVRRNWFKLWWFNGEQCELTTAGVALQREADAAAKVAA